MRLFVLAIAACGAAPVFHPDPERGCGDVTLAGQDDVAAAAGCTAVDSLTIKTGMALELGPLRRLETIRGALVVGPSVGLAELSLPRLRTAGTIKLVTNGNLHGVFLPALEQTGDLEIHGNGSLTSVSLPALRDVSRRVAITSNGELELVTLTALASAGELAITDNPKLAMVDSAAAFHAARTTIERNPMLPDDRRDAPPPDAPAETP